MHTLDLCSTYQNRILNQGPYILGLAIFCSTAEVPTEADTPEMEVPVVLRYQDLSKNEVQKVKRVVTPKALTGRLEVPEDIFKLWQDPKGQEKLLRLWCKSGGIKARYCKGICFQSRLKKFKTLCWKPEWKFVPIHTHVYISIYIIYIYIYGYIYI